MYDYNYGQKAPTYSRASLLFVPTISDIDKVPCMPGEKIWVMAMDDAVIACKTGGNMGIDTTYCRMTEYIPAPPPKPEDFVTKADLEEILAKYLKQGERANE